MMARFCLSKDDIDGNDEHCMQSVSVQNVVAVVVDSAIAIAAIVDVVDSVIAVVAVVVYVDERSSRTANYTTLYTAVVLLVTGLVVVSATFQLTVFVPVLVTSPVLVTLPVSLTVTTTGFVTASMYVYTTVQVDFDMCNWLMLRV